MEPPMKLFLILATAVAAVYSLPASRCFSDGIIIKEKQDSKAVSEFCLKDDVSMIKSHVVYSKNESGIFANSQILRKWIIKDWKLCSPLPTAGGQINVIEINHDLTLSTKTYVCTTDCTIGIDKENAQITFQTNKLNYFEVSGTTISSGWFKSKTSVSLDQTCEHLKVSCGKKSMQFHACFKQHMSCIRYLHKTALPGYMAASICSNIELIIMTTLTLAIFILLCIITKTYICYLLMPLFMPIAYIYGWLYNKSCKKCNCCGLSYHPFTNCGSYCVCGAKFETSDRMRIHRESGLCQGYKSLRVARKLCKSKGSSLVISVTLSVFIFSFITPIGGVIINDKLSEEKYSINQMMDAIVDLENFSHNVSGTQQVISVIFLLISCLFLLLTYRLNKIIQHLARSGLLFCEECSMYHSKKDIKYNGDFTNKCGFCTCGQPEDPEGLNLHILSQNCTYKQQFKWVKIIISILLSLIIIENSMILAAAETDCFSEKQISEFCLGPLLSISSCEDKNSRTFKGEAQKLVALKKITSDEAMLIESMGAKVEDALKMIQAQKSPDSMYTMEYVFLNTYCDYYSLFEHNSGYSQIKWRYILKTHQFDACARHSNNHFCRCMSDGMHCPSSDWDIADELNNTYITKPNFFKHDYNLLLDVITAAFPGTGAVFVIDACKKANATAIKTFSNNIIARFPYNNLLKGVMKFLQYISKHPSFKKYQPDTRHYDLIPVAPTARGRSLGRSNSYSDAQVGPPTKDCQKLKEVGCLSPKFGLPLESIISCGSSPNYKLYKKPQKYYKSNNKENTWCSKDVHCLHDFEPITEDVLEKVKVMTCWEIEPGTIEDIFTIASETCKINDRGVCEVNAAKWKIVKCETGLYYYTDHREGDDTGSDLGHYCLTHKCAGGRYPINPEILQNCIWEFHSQKSQYINQVDLEQIEEYKKALTEKLTHTLNHYNFLPTKNLPHISPNYKYVTLNGQETSDGIENSYIVSEIPAIAGTSIGLKVQTKNNGNIFDLIIYVKRADIIASYNHIYDTGPTIGHNVEHEELCTGQCPQHIPAKANWLTFSQERTSRWGCEEFGCLAINTGCVYGSCQDIIKPVAKVYRKSTEEKVELELCIVLPDRNFCTTLNALEPKITEEIELQFKTIDQVSLPNIVLLRDHKLFKGQINDLGTFGQNCGNVQKTNQSILGAGTVRFDYLCHSASRKDIIIRRCYNNNYDSCNHLQLAESLIFLDNHETLEVRKPNHILGTLSMKLMLGDFQYKTFAKDIELDFTGRCVGCIGCFEGFVCEMHITTTVEATCNLEASCQFFHNQLHIKPDVLKYYTKMTCQTDEYIPSKIKICNKEYKITIGKVQKNDKIEIDNSDQTSYIKEKDERCKTWLCRVRDEGISVIFEPLLNIFGNYGRIAVAVISAILALIVLVYILMPICMKIRDILKTNEKEFLIESKYK
ncbi:polyprotein [Potosi virus]|uniref:Envelopment polyprotein n=1 Tax=Potosi virus TaxID=273360 RepID=A0A291NVY0_9VIRU|nr:polyprotein [Potosi virus]ATJ04183.1 polyprotein [Potosi virus]